MIEVEAKFKLSPEVSRDQLIDIITTKIDAPLKEKHQIDTIFLLPDQVSLPIVPGSKIMRVRDVLDPTSGALIKTLMTLKVEREIKLASDEYEFTVENGAAARKMLVAMGWQEVVTVDKLRAESRIDRYNICIDEVARLGLFIELEVMAGDDANAKEIQDDMKSFLQDLNLAGEPWVTPYDTSIRNLQN